MQKICWILISILYFNQAQASPLEKNRWHDFEGMIGKQLAHISVFVEDAGNVTGKMCYSGKQSTYRLQGTMEGNQIQITIYQQNQSIAQVTGVLTSTDADRIEGEWKELATGSVQAIKISYIASCGGDLTHRYTTIDFADSVAERFMQTAVEKILAKDKKWVAQNTFYPLNTSYMGKKGVTIRNAQELLNNYDRIFYPDYLLKFRDLCYCGLFHNYRGLMLGRGELWIGQVPSAPGKKPRLVINAVNN